MLILLQKFIRQIVNAQSNTLLYSRSVNIIIPRVYNLKNGHGYSILFPVILSLFFKTVFVVSVAVKIVVLSLIWSSRLLSTINGLTRQALFTRLA